MEAGKVEYFMNEEQEMKVSPPSPLSSDPSHSSWSKDTRRLSWDLHAKQTENGESRYHLTAWIETVFSEESVHSKPSSRTKTTSSSRQKWDAASVLTVSRPVFDNFVKVLTIGRSGWERISRLRRARGVERRPIRKKDTIAAEGDGIRRRKSISMLALLKEISDTWDSFGSTKK